MGTGRRKARQDAKFRGGSRSRPPAAPVERLLPGTPPRDMQRGPPRGTESPQFRDRCQADYQKKFFLKGAEREY